MRNNNDVLVTLPREETPSFHSRPFGAVGQLNSGECYMRCKDGAISLRTGIFIGWGEVGFDVIKSLPDRTTITITTRP